MDHIHTSCDQNASSFTGTTAGTHGDH